jgi:hypothetical protein
MIPLMLPLLLLLLVCIIVNSTTSLSRQNTFFDCLRNKKGVPRKINYSRSISASARSSNSDTKDQVFDMPISLNYGSTGRPPGEYHLRHSLKKVTNILECLQPPFDIFFIEITNNDNNNSNIYIICYYNNGGTQTTINCNTCTHNDNKEADTDTAHSIHRTDNINKNGPICYSTTASISLAIIIIIALTLVQVQQQQVLHIEQYQHY